MPNMKDGSVQTETRNGQTSSGPSESSTLSSVSASLSARVRSRFFASHALRGERNGPDLRRGRRGSAVSCGPFAESAPPWAVRGPNYVIAALGEARDVGKLVALACTRKKGHAAQHPVLAGVLVLEWVHALLCLALGKKHRPCQSS